MPKVGGLLSSLPRREKPYNKLQFTALDYASVGGVDPTWTAPGNLLEGDIAIIAASGRNSNTYAVSGFTTAWHYDLSSGEQQRFQFKFLTPADSGATWVQDLGSDGHTTFMVLRANTGAPTKNYAKVSALGTGTASAITLPPTRALVFFAWQCSVGSTTPINSFVHDGIAYTELGFGNWGADGYDSICFGVWPFAEAKTIAARYRSGGTAQYRSSHQIYFPWRP